MSPRPLGAAADKNDLSGEELIKEKVAVACLAGIDCHFLFFHADDTRAVINWARESYVMASTIFSISEAFFLT